VGRPRRKPLARYQSFLYQAASWKRPRRVVAKVEFHLGELFPRVGFIVTNLTTSCRSVVRFYNRRGTAEQWIKEGKQAAAMTRLSCHRFRANEVRLWLSVLAYNLGNLWRRLALPKAIGNWSLTSLQQRVIKTGGRLIKHARYYLALAGRKPPHPAALCRHAREDRGAADAGGVGGEVGNFKIERRADGGRRGVCGNPPRASQIGVWRRRSDRTERFASRPKRVQRHTPRKLALWRTFAA
jgi:Transposase DDE domain group 1